MNRPDSSDGNFEKFFGSASMEIEPPGPLTASFSRAVMPQLDDAYASISSDSEGDDVDCFERAFNPPAPISQPLWSSEPAKLQGVRAIGPISQAGDSFIDFCQQMFVGNLGRTQYGQFIDRVDDSSWLEAVAPAVREGFCASEDALKDIDWNSHNPPDDYRPLQTFPSHTSQMPYWLLIPGGVLLALVALLLVKVSLTGPAHIKPIEIIDRVVPPNGFVQTQTPSPSTSVERHLAPARRRRHLGRHVRKVFHMPAPQLTVEQPNTDREPIPKTAEIGLAHGFALPVLPPILRFIPEAVPNNEEVSRSTIASKRPGVVRRLLKGLRRIMPSSKHSK